MKKLLFSISAALFLCGCVQYQYKGTKAEPQNGPLPVFTDSAKITRPYRVLGQATVSGNYEQVSRDKLLAKLLAEGRKCGADAILLVEQQVIPGSARKTPAFMTAFDYDDSNRNWSMLSRDVNQNFGCILDGNKESDAPGLSSYKRMIRAEFLKYNPEPKVK